MCAKALQESLPRMDIKEARSIIEGIKESSTVSEAAKIVWNDREQYRKAVELVGGITSAQYDMNRECDRHFHEFERLLQNDYQEFARNNNYPAEAEAHNRLLNISARMRHLRLAPHLASRNICAVAGSFSSGKSRFLNALIGGDEDVLPEGITKTTSLPTYIFHVDESKLTINIFNYDGGKKQIDTRTFKEMTHAFKKKYGIALKQIVDRVEIYTPSLKNWDRIAFIDTPGYTSSDEQDKKVALQQVLDSRFLIWMVDCEKGTLTEEDIGFIYQFLEKRSPRGNAENTPVYIVLNKADKKRRHLQDILDSVKSITKKRSIPCFGISLYSAHEKRWYPSNRTFQEFLTMVNQTPVMIDLDKKVTSVFHKYIRYHKQELERFREIVGLMNRIDLIRPQSNLDHDLDRHLHYFSEKEKNHDKHAAEACSLQDKFAQCTRAFMKSCRLDQDRRNPSLHSSSTSVRRQGYVRDGKYFKTDLISLPTGMALKMVHIEPDKFLMGSLSWSQEGWDDERPRHWVTIDYSFSVGIHAVTFAQWDAHAANGACDDYRPDDEGWGRGNRPVTNVSWNDAQGYVQWLSEYTGDEYRLLSEAEWEYVARAGTTGPFYFGETISRDQANYAGRNQTVPVGSFPMNEFGLYDVHGNVWEWTQDCYENSYKGAPSNGSAWMPGKSEKVVRGGSWKVIPSYCRSAVRKSHDTGHRSNDVGFRIARIHTS